MCVWHKFWINLNIHLSRNIYPRFRAEVTNLATAFSDLILLRHQESMKWRSLSYSTCNFNKIFGKILEESRAITKWMRKGTHSRLLYYSHYHYWKSRKYFTWEDMPDFFKCYFKTFWSNFYICWIVKFGGILLLIKVILLHRDFSVREIFFTIGLI